ncbi:tetratricopeptide repeat protein [Krasilnikovia sp. MM14-A1259]|uniref:fibronectin type III domain-containing protein n=1 Tax=Krasilnikovia sp. MM14-A1259 TaxID=3373539 RepID=UPI00399CBD2D
MPEPSSLAAARQLALNFAGFGDVVAARAVLEQAVETGRAGLGEDDPDVLATAHQLASVHQQADDPAAARRVLEEAYAAGQWRLGDTDPLMLAISFDLGVVASELGNRHEARRAFSRVAEHGPAALGADHWTVAQAREFLGDAAPAPQPEQQATPPPAMSPTSGTGTGTGSMTPGPPSPAVPQATSGRDALSEATVTVPRVESRPTPRAPADPAPPPAWQVAQTSAPSAAGADPAPPPARQVAQTSGPSAAGAPVVAGVAGGSTYGRRGPALFAAIAAVLAAIIAVVALVVVLARGNERPDTPDRPSLGGAAPTDVRLRDSGSSLEVTWTDPASGMTSFVVSVGHPGEVLKPMGQVGPGQTSFSLKGLNAKLDYCVAVVAVYSTTKFASSPQTCTGRNGTDARPSTTQ